jgi:hypothetical protein
MTRSIRVNDLTQCCSLSLREERRRMLLHEAIQGGLFRAMALVVDASAHRRFGCGLDGRLHEVLRALEFRSIACSCATCNCPKCLVPKAVRPWSSTGIRPSLYLKPNARGSQMLSDGSKVKITSTTPCAIKNGLSSRTKSDSGTLERFDVTNNKPPTGGVIMPGVRL